MYRLTSVGRLRCLLVWLLATTTAALAIAWVAPDLRTDGLGLASFDRVVVWVAAVALAGCSLWAWVATTIVVGQALVDRPIRNAPVVPRWLRTAVLVACGLAVVGAGGTAHADEETARARADHRHTLAGLPSPDRVVGSTRPAPETRTARIHIVQLGDTLWDIAAADLGGLSDSGRITAHWQRIHALNRTVIGADPDLILPGQPLRLPAQVLDR
jgi:nucleoid-associated protein YgaU